MFKGLFIAAAEFDGRQPTFTIAEVKMHPVFDEKLNKERDKGTVWFKETDRGFVLCRTNGACLAALFGTDTREWVGKRVTLYATEVKFGRDTVLGIRIKGSPDLERDVLAEVKLPRRKAFTMRMVPTGKGGEPAVVADDAPEPGSDG